MIHPKEEKTFLLIKPDGVVRGLIGEIIRRIEQRGLKIVGLKMFQATREQINDHYPKDEKWINRLGEKTLATYEKYGYDAIKELGTKETLKIGQMVRGWLVDFMTSSPMIKVVIKGVHAIDMMRKLGGNTMPSMAEMGTIRGDFSVDSAALANREKRAVRNLLHMSEDRQEAEHELNFWFSADEVHDYERSDEKIMFG